MPERPINTKSATGCLLILLPAALAMSALFVAWPLILGVTVAIAGGNIWQNYEWSKTARSIDPVFQQLIVQNRGEISPIDISLKANVSAPVSKKYLAIKANEFGTGSRQHPDRGQVYYFVSVSTLGSIFDDSERDVADIEPATIPVAALQPSTTPPVATTAQVAFEPTVTPPVTTAAIPDRLVESAPPQPAQPVAPSASVDVRSSSAPPEVTAPATKLSNLRQLFDEEESAPTTTTAKTVEPTPVTDTPTAPPPDLPLVTIVQSELAKRLDVHSSTVYKRRSEPGFTDWTRNRDPDGLAWGYAEDTKEYYRVDT
jgi:hypothetical protein